MGLFSFLRKKPIPASIGMIETDKSSFKGTAPAGVYTIIHNSSVVPANEPIIIQPKIAFISWWQFWRWHLVSERKKRVKEYIQKFRNIFDKPNEKMIKMVNTSLKDNCSIMIHLRKPVYEHDCNNCTYLGSINRDLGGGEKLFDLYFCEQGKLPTVIARYGNKGDSYISGMEFAETCTKDSDHPLAIALTLAKDRDLIS